MMSRGILLRFSLCPFLALALDTTEKPGTIILVLKQSIFAVLTTTDLVIILLIQNRAHTAYTANAASARAMDAIR